MGYDNRNLDYSRYFCEGQKSFEEVSDYNSHNTERLSLKEVKNILLELDYVQEQLNA